jgi:polysaccharide pyruvyl transferase WcaK-like protein
MKKIFLIGYYGYKNYGDDLLFKALIKILEDIGFEGKIVIPE